MKFTYNWLKEHIDLNIKPEELTAKLISSGLNVESVQETKDDFIFDVEITPNRPDYLSVRGIARLLSAVLNLQLKPINLNLKEDANSHTKDFIKIDIPEINSGQVLNSQLCKRYTARVLLDVKVEESPEWLRTHLLAVGIRPINNIVDITNFVMIDLGHPLHPFDYDLITGKQIIIRTAMPKETITTLDGIKRELADNMLVIADSSKPIALAGIMGAENTQITSSTKNVLLESAYFHPSNIRNSAKLLKLSTEASYRFERGTDYEGLVLALNKTAELINSIAHGKIAKEMIDIYPKKFQPVQINLRPNRTNKILGIDIDTNIQTKILSSLGFIVEQPSHIANIGQPSRLSITVPSFRVDVQREIDLIEEIAQIFGYDKIEKELPKISISNTYDYNEKKNYDISESIKNTLVGCGFNEVINYGLVNSSQLDILQDSNRNQSGKSLLQIKLINPLTNDWNVMRTTLLPCLLSNVATNINHKNLNLKLFELGKVFFYENNQPIEKISLGIILTGFYHRQWWQEKAKESTLYDLKGIIELILKNIGINSVPENNIEILNELSPEILKIWDIKQPVYFAEFNIDKLIKHSNFKKYYSPLARYPEIRRDIAIIVDKNISHETLQKNLIQWAGNLVTNIEL
ncbi:MAG: phenylalanine--tRNA ligase subunit beta, partial [Candidatus Firestonebacteria bacterium]